MDSDAMQLQPSATNSDNGTPVFNSKASLEDDDEQAAFLNSCIENETIDFEKIALDKQNARIDGSSFWKIDRWTNSIF